MRRKGAQVFDIRGLNIAIELWGVAFCLTGAVTAALFSRTDRKRLNLLLLMFAAELVASSGDAVAGIYRGQAGTVAWLATHLGNFATFAGNFSLLAAFTLFICVRLHDAGGGRYRPWSTGIWIITAAMCLFTALGAFYKIDESNLYVRSDLYWVIYLHVLLVCVGDIVLILRDRRFLRRSEIACFLFYAASPLLAMGAQVLIYGLNFVIIAGVIGTVILSIETQVNTARTFAQQTAELAQSRVDVSESRIKVMVSQIQPHFIFNTLDSIYYLCAENPEKAQLAIDRFSTYLRANLASLSKTEAVPIETELEHVRTYLSLEQLSMEDLLTWEIDDQAHNFSVPALSLQTLAENAVKHGIGGKPEGGKVVVRTREARNCWLASVEDNGVGFDTEALRREGSVGIENTRMRLAATCGGTLEITSTPGHGTTAVMRIPKEARP